VEQAAVGKAGADVVEILVVQRNDLAHILLLVAATAVLAGFAWGSAQTWSADSVKPMPQRQPARNDGCI
jgi:hypothetical protein